MVKNQINENRSSQQGADISNDDIANKLKLVKIIQNLLSRKSVTLIHIEKISNLYGVDLNDIFKDFICANENKNEVEKDLERKEKQYTQLELATGIINLLNTKKATLTQIKMLASTYEIDLSELLNGLEDYYNIKLKLESNSKSELEDGDHSDK